MCVRERGSRVIEGGEEYLCVLVRVCKFVNESEDVFL